MRSRCTSQSLGQKRLMAQSLARKQVCSHMIQASRPRPVVCHKLPILMVKRASCCTEVIQSINWQQTAPSWRHASYCYTVTCQTLSSSRSSRRKSWRRCWCTRRLRTSTRALKPMLIQCLSCVVLLELSANSSTMRGISWIQSKEKTLQLN